MVKKIGYGLCLVLSSGSSLWHEPSMRLCMRGRQRGNDLVGHIRGERAERQRNSRQSLTFRKKSISGSSLALL